MPKHFLTEGFPKVAVVVSWAVRPLHDMAKDKILSCKKIMYPNCVGIPVYRLKVYDVFFSLVWSPCLNP